jgi:two-component system, chemotaxis family, chemotaxis protein CheY
MNVLAVDDDEQMRKLLLFALSTQGHHVAVASNDLEAFEAIQSSSPDVLVTDLSMPVMDGAELIEVLQSIPDYSTIPIVVISGDRDALENLGGDCGAIWTMQKPLELKELWAILADIATHRCTRIGRER